MRATIAKHKVPAFYLLTFLISWTFWGVMALTISDPTQITPLTFLFSSLGALGPLLALLLLDRLTRRGAGDDEDDGVASGAVSLKAIFAQIRLREIRLWWALPAAVAYPVIVVVSQLLTRAVGFTDRLRLIASGPDELGLALLPVILIQFVTGLVTSPLFEEPGWRGFALPRLQARLGREGGSLLVAVLWWLWHQGMNLPFSLTPTVYNFAIMVIFSFMIDSLYNLSNHNLLAAMLAHQSASTVFSFLNQGANNPFQLGLMLLLVAALRLREPHQISTIAEEP